MEQPDQEFNDVKDVIEGKEAFTWEDIDTILAGNHDIRDKALFAVLYLTNSRVSEIVGRLKKHQITHSSIGDKEFVIFEGLYTEKNALHPRRNIPINVEKEASRLSVVNEYISIFEPQDILFDIGRHWAWAVIKRMSGERCHYLRHSRLTHLRVRYGLGIDVLARMAGWQDARMGMRYAHLSWHDIGMMM